MTPKVIWGCPMIKICNFCGPKMPKTAKKLKQIVVAPNASKSQLGVSTKICIFCGPKTAKKLTHFVFPKMPPKVIWDSTGDQNLHIFGTKLNKLELIYDFMNMSYPPSCSSLLMNFPENC